MEKEADSNERSMKETEMAESEEDAENIDESSNRRRKKTSEEYLRELNLVLILSFLSLSDEQQQRLEFEEIIKPKEDIVRQHHHHNKPKINGVRVCKQEPKNKANEFRALDRQTHQFQTNKIRDCRHCRRM